MLKSHVSLCLKHVSDTSAAAGVLCLAYTLLGNHCESLNVTECGFTHCVVKLNTVIFDTEVTSRLTSVKLAAEAADEPEDACARDVIIFQRGARAAILARVRQAPI